MIHRNSWFRIRNTNCHSLKKKITMAMTKVITVLAGATVPLAEAVVLINAPAVAEKDKS